MNNSTRAHAVAAGARALLDTHSLIWDRHTRSQRPATSSDVAILCRTNEQCRLVAEALGQLGIASVVARVGLLDSAEAQVLIAGLELWVDPRDRLAAATLVRILDHPDDPAVFLDKVLAPDSRDKLADGPAAAVFLSSLAGSSVIAGAEFRDLDVLAAVDAVMNALDLRRLCASWGNATQRTANLDAIRAHASRYCDERRAGGDAPAVVGFLTYLGSLVSESRWDKSRHDTAARVGADESVTVSTWHAAKGLEWPIVILFGLESVREPEAYGVHVLTDRTHFDVGDPLGGRRVHFWPNPYTTANQGGPIKDAYARSPAFQEVIRQSEREALRVLYVGWTRARDQLVLAAEEGELLAGLLKTLHTIEPGLIVDPGVATAGLVDTMWGRHAFRLQVTPCQPLAATPSVVQAGMIRTGRSGADYAAGSIVPSSAPPRACRLGEPVVLGLPAELCEAGGLIDRNDMGMTVHDFFAADDCERTAAERLAMARALLQRYAVAEAMDGSELVKLADRLWRWTISQFGERVVVRREWPVGMRFDSGTVALGNVDLMVEGDRSIAVIDHKSFGLATATEKADILGGQLRYYADAIKKARPTKVLSTWVHLPLAGIVVPVEFLAD
jgi:ATP-dependent exoDNAse (exonuclease V) beta subunit